MNLDVTKFLEDLSGRHARNYADIVQDMLIAIATDNRPALAAARERMEKVVNETMGTAEVLGASIVLRGAAKLVVEDSRQEFRQIARRDGYPQWRDVWLPPPGHQLRPVAHFASSSAQTLIPRVTFTEAGQDMVDRTPVTIRAAAERTWRNISKLYGEGKNVAFVRSAEQAVTERVQALITEAINEGIAEADIGKKILRSVAQVRKRTAAWTESYAKMAFRTNLNTAVTAGRFKQAQDPDIAKVIPAFRFDTAGDSDVRSNHKPMDGIIMSVFNRKWRKYSSPLGWNCRCQMTLMGLPLLRRMGRISENGTLIEDDIPAGASPDVGFRPSGRPDLFA